MALKLIKGKLLPIGIDLGLGSVKMAQMRLSEQGVEMIAAASAEIPAACRGDLRHRLDFIAESLRNNLKTGNFSGRQAIISLPASHVFLQHVKIPRTPADQIDSMLKFELQGKLPYSPEQAVIRHVVAGEVLGDSEGKQEVIVVAVERSMLEAYLEMTRKVKLDVTGVNIESCAIVECFGRLFQRTADADRAIMFIDLGASTTQVVLTHGNKLVFARSLQTGEAQIDQAIAAGMNLSPEQAHSLRWDLHKGGKDPAAQDELYRNIDGQLNALADEVTLCLRYYESVFRNQPVERVIFVGGQAYDKRLCQSLAQRLNLPAQIGDPLVRVKRIDGAGLQIGLDRREPQPHWTVAVGLSLGAGHAA